MTAAVIRRASRLFPCLVVSALLVGPTSDRADAAGRTPAQSCQQLWDKFFDPSADRAGFFGRGCAAWAKKRERELSDAWNRCTDRHPANAGEACHPEFDTYSTFQIKAGFVSDLQSTGAAQKASTATKPQPYDSGFAEAEAARRAADAAAADKYRKYLAAHEGDSSSGTAQDTAPSHP